MLDRPQRHMRPPASEVTPDTLIWCPWCAEEHPASAFNVESRRYSGLAGICREAMAAKRKTAEGQQATKRRNQRRWANPKYRDASLASAAARRRTKGPEDLRRAKARLQRIVDDWKLGGCIDCGYSDIRAIDPDHIDETTKHDNVSRMIQLCASAARIRAELAKCERRCARCHRKRTGERRPSSWRTAERLPPSWQRRLELQDFNDSMKMRLGCSDCGWAGWARGLDWDHARGTKHYDISRMINERWPILMIARELSKCDVVCANCHRIRTAVRRQKGTT